MPAKNIRVNLLGQSDLEHTPWGRIVTWATTYGRYIMISTEVVVLLAFISRFSLDRKLTDLKDEISQKQSIIDANADFERDVRALQNQLAKIKTFLGEQERPVGYLTSIQEHLPPDVYLLSFSATGNKLIVDATAGTSAGFSQFLANMTADKKFSGLAIGETSRPATGGIKFQLTAALASASAAKK